MNLETSGAKPTPLHQFSLTHKDILMWSNPGSTFASAIYNWEYSKVNSLSYTK